MLDTGAFQTLAEFSIALAGFVGVVVVFRRREGRLHPADDIRIFIALVPSLAGAFLALLPVGLDLLVLDPTTSLIFSSATYAAVVVLLLLVVASGVYFIGVMAILVASATVFARIVFIRPDA